MRWNLLPRSWYLLFHTKMIRLSFLLTAVEWKIMSKYIPGNQKHLTLEDRIYIEDELNRGTTFKDIAKFLCKDPTTISKEVKAHRISDWYHKGTFYNAKNFCVHRYHCRKTNACGKIILCGVKCSSCPTCNQTCRDFEKERCSRLDKAPYVCNGCPKKISHCTIARMRSIWRLSWYALTLNRTKLIEICCQTGSKLFTFLNATGGI